MCDASQTMSNTSDIPLLRPDGSRWVTIAKQNFPMEYAAIHHPAYSPSEDMVIATLEYSFPNSDIGLAKLNPGMKYSSTLFDADDANDTTFVGLVGIEDIGLCQLLYLDSPYNGNCEGLVTSMGFCIIPTRSTNGPFQYIVCNMLYFGDGADEIFDGTCRSALWTSDNAVAGFFQWYHMKRAIAFAPSVDVLISSSYTLEAID